MNLTSNTVLHETPCATSVLGFFGVSGVTWNHRTKKNVWDATLRRNGFNVRSRFSQLGKNEQTVGAARKKLVKLASEDVTILAFVVRVKGHVLVVSREGATVVDTAPRKRDRREILKVVAIFKK